MKARTRASLHRKKISDLILRQQDGVALLDPKAPVLPMGGSAGSLPKFHLSNTRLLGFTGSPMKKGEPKWLPLQEYIRSADPYLFWI